MTGEKTRIGIFGVNASVERNDCKAALSNTLPTLLERAEDAGFATGIVSTTRITHATPAATYAHVPNRDWESDQQLPAAAREEGCRDIARQLVEFSHGDGIDVILGGGRALFMPSDADDPEYQGIKGVRGDERDLIKAWQQGAKDRHYVWNDEQLRAIASSSGQLLGLFDPSHLQFDIERVKKDGAGEPSLAEMTRTAIERLSNNPQGFFLMVEGGKIDHAHHAGNAHRALTDTIAFADAVAAADGMTS
jgi:alkaline phosphatase